MRYHKHRDGVIGLSLGAIGVRAKIQGGGGKGTAICCVHFIRLWAAFHFRVFSTCVYIHGKVYILLTFTNEITNGIKDI